MNTINAFVLVLLWISCLHRLHGQILVFARSLSPLQDRISVTLPNEATVHDLISEICAESGHSKLLIPSITLSFGGTELSPYDTLADVGLGSETEVTYYMRRYEFTVVLDYIAESAFDVESVHLERNMSVPVGCGDILEEMRQQIREWTITRVLSPRISRNAPIGFVLHRTTWHDAIEAPCASWTHFFDFQIPENHIGRLVANTAILRDTDLLQQIRNTTIARVRADDTVEAVGMRIRYATVHESATVILSQLCSFTMSPIRIWPQKPSYQHTIFVHMDIPGGFEILLKPQDTD